MCIYIYIIMDKYINKIKESRDIKQTSLNQYISSFKSLNKALENKDFDLQFFKNTNKVLNYINGLKLSTQKNKLTALIVFLNAYEDKYKDELKIFRNKCFIYTNNLELSEQLDLLGMFEEVRVSEVAIARPRNTVKSRYPGYRLRIYFKPIDITETERHNIIQFIDNNDHSIKMNVGMERFYGGTQARGRYLTLRDYYFIDLKDERLASMLELTCPGIIRKTMDIIYDDK